MIHQRYVILHSCEALLSWDLNLKRMKFFLFNVDCEFRGQNNAR